MIAGSSLAKAIALGFAAAVVMGAVQIAFPDEPVKIQGGGEQVATRMGSQFEDMVAGTLSAVTPQEETPDAPTPPVEESQTTSKVVAAVEPKVAEQAQPDRSLATEPSVLASSPTVHLTAAPSFDAILPVPTAQILAVSPQITTAVPVKILQSVTVPTVMTPTIVTLTVTKPVSVETQPVDLPETIVATAPDSTAPPLSVRPKSKNRDLSAKVAARQPKGKDSKPKIAQAKPKRGNAKRNNTHGSASGKIQAAKSKANGASSKRIQQEGNAAVSNYPGQVMRRISRVSKPRVSSKGTAIVSFSISQGGGLASLSIARSSGSSALDKAALGVIRKSAPFPRPPAGALRQYSIRVKGR